MNNKSINFTGYVYKLTCPITNEFYIGSRKFNGDPLLDDYMGSYGRWKPVDKNLLKKEILHYGIFENGNQILKLESEFIKEHKTNPLNRNYQIPSENTFCMHGTKVSEETKEKMRLAKIGKKHTEESKMKMSISLKGKKHTEETKLKWSIERKAKKQKRSEETCKRISEALTGKTHTEESKQKNREKHLGKSLTEESKKKISEKMKGVTKSPETIEKMKLAWIKRKQKTNIL